MNSSGTKAIQFSNTHLKQKKLFTNKNKFSMNCFQWTAIFQEFYNIPFIYFLLLLELLNCKVERKCTESGWQINWLLDFNLNVALILEQSIAITVYPLAYTSGSAGLSVSFLCMLCWPHHLFHTPLHPSLAKNIKAILIMNVVFQNITLSLILIVSELLKITCPY